MGIKLIYYKIDNGRLIFGSEIRPILAANGTKPAVDPVALRTFYKLVGTLSRPLPFTKVFESLRLARCWFVKMANDYEKIDGIFLPTGTFLDGKKRGRKAREELLELYRGAVGRRHTLERCAGGNPSQRQSGFSPTPRH